MYNSSIVDTGKAERIMQIEERVMDSQERIGFLLRSLYAGYGYSRYRMGKFEYSHLYSMN